MSRRLDDETALQRARETAAARGGQLLSTAYTGVDGVSRWRCGAGHEWETTYWSVVSRGSWCKVCSGRAVIPEEAFARARAIAHERGGAYLEEAYLGRNTQARWLCASGHSWTATLHNIAAGKWCPWCAGNKVDAGSRLGEAQAYAKSRGGLLLDDSYRGNKVNMTWQCGAGHVWSASFGTVVNRKAWCGRCCGTQRDAEEQLAKAQLVAAEKGGACLEASYRDNEHKMAWRCAAGHEWHAPFYAVVNAGSWCAICASGLKERLVRRAIEELLGLKFDSSFPDWLVNPRTGRRLQLDGYNSDLKLAFEYQGDHHYEVVGLFKMTEERLKGQIYRDQLKRKACKERGVRLLTVPRELAPERMAQWLHQRISKMPDLAPRLKSWRDVEIVQWTPSERWSVADMQAAARERGGDCHSPSYLGAREKYEWECSVGHRWKAVWDAVRRGSWCSVCCGNVINPDDRLAQAQTYARSCGGECMSDVYSKDRMLFRCAEGHTWSTRWYSVMVIGTWCPECARRERGLASRGVKSYKELKPARVAFNTERLRLAKVAATEQGGECLSSEYKGIHAKMKFSCAAGHTWETAWRNFALLKTWCAKCARRSASTKLTAAASERRDRTAPLCS